MLYVISLGLARTTKFESRSLSRDNLSREIGRDASDISGVGTRPRSGPSGPPLLRPFQAGAALYIYIYIYRERDIICIYIYMYIYIYIYTCMIFIYLFRSFDTADAALRELRKRLEEATGGAFDRS